MPVLRTTYVQSGFDGSPEYQGVHQVSDRLLGHLNEADPQRLIAEANAPGQSSALVQASFAVFAAELGFTSEAKEPQILPFTTTLSLVNVMMQRCL